MILVVPWMASSFILLLIKLHFRLLKPKAMDISSLAGSQEPSAPTTRGKTGPRCRYFSSLLPCARTILFGMLNGTVASMIKGGLTEVM